jgi:hypothetical protein
MDSLEEGREEEFGDASTVVNDEDSKNIRTIFPHELERVEEERGEQMAKQEEEEEEEEINSNRLSNYRARCKRSMPPHKAPYQHSNLKSSLLQIWVKSQAAAPPPPPELEHIRVGISESRCAAAAATTNSVVVGRFQEWGRHERIS